MTGNFGKSLRFVINPNPYGLFNDSGYLPGRAGPFGPVGVRAVRISAPAHRGAAVPTVAASLRAMSTNDPRGDSGMGLSMGHPAHGARARPDPSFGGIRYRRIREAKR